MITEEVRPIREVERKLLLARLEKYTLARQPRTAKRLLSWLGLVLLCAALPVGLTFLVRNPVVVGLSAALMLLGGLLCLFYIMRIIEDYFLNRGARHEFSTSTRPLMESTLNTGSVLSTRVTATSVIEVAEDEDMGSGYIFDIGDDRSFLLKAQWSEPVDDDLLSPCSEFEIVRSPDKKLYIGLFCAGAKLEPTRVVELSKYNESVAWDELEEVVAKTPEKLMVDLFGK